MPSTLDVPAMPWVLDAPATLVLDPAARGGADRKPGGSVHREPTAPEPAIPGDAAGSTRCRVLGPLEVEIDGVLVDLGGPLPRRLLAGLLSAEGAPVRDAALAELAWPDRPPTTISCGLQVAVSRLRSALGPDGRRQLLRDRDGYRFRVDPERTDAGRFIGLVAQGAALLADHRAGDAVRAYSASLRLWRGEPWTELADSAVVAGSRARLHELREVAVEELQAARLATGDAERAVAELREAVAASPFRERRWELLVLGLYRCGRQGHALAELRRVRELLADELGIDPGPGLRGLERRLLHHDPTLLAGGAPEARPDRLPAKVDAAPAPVAARARPTHPVPRPLSSFVGRRAELAWLAGPLAGKRLVTVVGPAGVGKTRLAVEHLARASAADGDVWWVPLADVSGPEALARVARVLGVDRASGHAPPGGCAISSPLPSALTSVADLAARRPGILVLDNCEHVVDAVGEWAVTLLARCPRLRIMATSQVPLGVDGERVVSLAPLPVVGDADADGDASGNAHAGGRADGDAVALLIDRVRAARPGWHPTESERATARHICATLDGLPLAIELAAARERAFGLDGVAAHLHDRFALLGPAPRGSLTPHAGLRAAISRSVELLTEAERTLLLRLWPFEGGFTERAADAVRPPGTEGRPALSTLASLVDRSVVMTDTTTNPARYRLLESVRSFCRAVDPDPAGTVEAHATWARG